MPYDNETVDCPAVQAELSSFVDGALSDEVSAAIQQHLLTCVACGAEEAALRRVMAALRQIYRPAPPESLRRRVLAEAWSESEAIPDHLDVLIVRTEEMRNGECFFCERREAEAYPITPALPATVAPGYDAHPAPVSLDAFQATIIN